MPAELKSLVCDVCNKKFKRRSHLKRHISVVHEGQKPFNSELCGKKFHGKWALKCHVDGVHEGKPFKGV